MGLAAGVLRLALVARMPERSERTGRPIRVRDALALLRTHPRLRRYLLGVGVQGALWTATLPFVIVMMRRVIGMSDAQVIGATVAAYAGGLVSLYPWGRVVDALGPARVFRWCSLGLAASFAALLLVREPGALRGRRARGLLLRRRGAARRVRRGRHARALRPRARGRAGEPDRRRDRRDLPAARGRAARRGPRARRVLAGGVAPLAAYQALFVAAAALQALVFLPLRRFGRRPAP